VITEDNRGFKLDEKDDDATYGRRAFYLNPCAPEDAIEVKFTPKDSIQVIAGHHTLN